MDYALAELLFKVVVLYLAPIVWLVTLIVGITKKNRLAIWWSALVPAVAALTLAVGMIVANNPKMFPRSSCGGLGIFCGPEWTVLGFGMVVTVLMSLSSPVALLVGKGAGGLTWRQQRAAKKQQQMEEAVQRYMAQQQGYPHSQPQQPLPPHLRRDAPQPGPQDDWDGFNHWS